MATTLPGVRPSMSFASFPTATTSPVFLLMATILGSFTTMPLPFENTSVFAVPKSIARSDENKLNTDRKLYPLFDIFPLRLRPQYPCPPPRPFRIMCCQVHKTVYKNSFQTNGQNFLIMESQSAREMFWCHLCDSVP